MRPSKMYSNADAVDNALAAGVEEVVITSEALLGTQPEAEVLIIGHVALTGAVGLTSVTLRVRRGGLAGAVVGELAVQQVAGAVASHAVIMVTDNVPNLGGQRYVLTAEATGGAATANYMDITAIVT